MFFKLIKGFKHNSVYKIRDHVESMVNHINQHNLPFLSALTLICKVTSKLFSPKDNIHLPNP